MISGMVTAIFLPKRHDMCNKDPISLSRDRNYLNLFSLSFLLNSYLYYNSNIHSGVSFEPDSKRSLLLSKPISSLLRNYKKNKRLFKMDNKKFIIMSKRFPKFRVKINPRLAVQRGGMVAWVTMLTLGAGVGIAYGFFKIHYPYTFRRKKTETKWRAFPDFVNNSVGFRKLEVRSNINHLL